MRILVIGGSYFYGRVFVMLAAKEHDVTVVNRGTYSMEEFGVKQVRGDRHDPGIWRQCTGDYDAVVDFCAYAPGDIEEVLGNLPGSVGQYIFISTVDVYRRQGGTVADGILKDEEFPLEERRFPGEAGSYISGKVALEGELRRACGARGVPFTVLRPAILYGPYNYAPRESLFIRMALTERALPRFTDADGSFQLVYVRDAAEAALRCVGNIAAYGQAYNLCGDETADYGLFFRELAACAEEAQMCVQEESGVGERTADGSPEERAGLTELPMTLAQAEERGIPVPFPAAARETELVSNKKSRQELGVAYTSLHEGMSKTFRAFSRVYTH